MAQLLGDIVFDLHDANGNPYSGAKAYFYLTGTTTDAQVYQDADLSTPHTQPVEANSAGRFAPIYLDTAITYRCVVKTAAGGAIDNGDIDPVNAAGTIGTANIANSAVTSAKLGASAVTTAKIADGNVTNAKFADAPTLTLKGRVASGSGAPTDLEVSDLNKILGRTGQLVFDTTGDTPAGTIPADGVTRNRADYPNLWAKVEAGGNTVAEGSWSGANEGLYSTGDGSTTFRPPKLDDGYFIRSTGGNAGAAGVKVADKIKNHTHAISPAATAWNTGTSGGTSGGGSISATNSVAITANNSGGSAAETAPAAVAYKVFICI